MLAIAGALDGEIAMPATPLLMRSSTIWTSPASSALDAGPVYRQVYSDFGFSLFHRAQPSPSTVKNGLSRPLTTTARVFFWAQIGPAARIAASATPATFSIALFMSLLLYAPCAIRTPDSSFGPGRQRGGPSHRTAPKDCEVRTSFRGW